MIARPTPALGPTPIPRGGGILPRMDRIVIRGAREHNLKNISLELPRGKFIVITGVSGSGKSTLAFDTIYAEGQRRYVESLSSYARQFLGVMDKPEVESIEGLSPAISIDQKTTSHNPRSTVGTVTEIHDYLRLLFARVGQAFCPECGRPIEKQSASEITDRLLKRPPGTRAILMAPLVRGRKGEYRKLFQQLLKEGYARVRVDGVIYLLEEAQGLSLEKYEKHDIDLVIDRVVLKEEERPRIAEAVELALLRGEGLLRVLYPDTGEEELFSEKFACPEHGSVLEELEPRIFSFNSPYGACPACSGLGYRQEFDPELVVNPELSLAEGAILPWSRGRDTGRSYLWDRLRALAEHLGFDLKTPFKDLPEEAKRAVLYGLPEPFEVVFRRGGKETFRVEVRYEGVIPWLEKRYQESDSEGVREALEGFMSLRPCPACGGTRYKREVLSVKVAGRNIAEVSALPVREALAFFQGLEKTLPPSRPRSPGPSSGRSWSGSASWWTWAWTTSPWTGRPTPSPEARPRGSGSRPRWARASPGSSTCWTSPASASTPGTTSASSAPSKGSATWATPSSWWNTTRRPCGPPTGSWTWVRGRGSTGEVVAQGTLEDILKSPQSLTGAYLRGKRGSPCPRSAARGTASGSSSRGRGRTT